MRGEELQGLSIEQLQEVEKSLECGLNRVIKRKSDKITTEINHLHKKGMQLMEENKRLRDQVSPTQLIFLIKRSLLVRILFIYRWKK
ncbi:MADS-box protein SVP [Linum perenne]